MVKSWQFLMVLAVVGCVFFSSAALAGNTADRWEMASKNMILALQGENDGLKASVLQNIIRFGDSLEVQGAIYDVMNIYRSHRDERMRQLALIALYKMNNQWALSFLERAIKFEKSPRMQKTICAILRDCHRPVNLDRTLIAQIQK